MNNFCPDCGKITKGQSCPCGWKDNTRPPSMSAHEFHEEQLRIKFNRLPMNHKNLIRQADAVGFKWNGEDTHRIAIEGKTHFEHVFDQFKDMREIGIEEYRQKAMAIFRNFTPKRMG